MPSPSEQLHYQTATLQDLMAGVKGDQWDNPTPCAKWTVRDLAGHLVGGGTMFAASFRGDTVEVDADDETPDLLGDDPAAALAGMIADFEASAGSPGAMERDVVLPFGTLPAQVALDLVKFDLLIHAWDLARATGQPFDPPAEVVDSAPDGREDDRRDARRRHLPGCHGCTGGRELDRSARGIHGPHRLGLRALSEIPSLTAFARRKRAAP
ncbi:MAG: TIGR03086 family metal-binding protein [Acidimicrobiia bacterium]|nr:TIGR03086 family metal-binding protein [Acidimicrobiia bacterium]